MRSEENLTNQPRRETVAEIVASLMKRPRTLVDLAEMVGCADSTAAAWVHAFHESGLVRIAERLPRERSEGAKQYQLRRIVYAWQPQPYGEPDVVAP